MKILKKYRKFFIFGLAMTVSLVVTGCSFFSEKPEFKDERVRVEQYLREKYGVEFTAKEVSYLTRLLGGNKEIETHAISKEQKPVEVLVSRFVNDEAHRYYRETVIIKGKEDLYSYLDFKWDREAEEKIQKIAEDIFSRPVLMHVRIDMPDKYSDQMFGTIPSYFATVKSNPEIFLHKNYTYQTFVVAVFDDFKGKDQEKEQIYALINEFNNLGIQNYILSVCYFPKDFEREAKGIIADIGFNEFIGLVDGNVKDGKYKIDNKLQNEFLIKKDEVKNIKKSEDILKYLKN